MTTVFYDVETGGVEPQHPTIQLAAIAVDDAGEEIDAFEQKILFDENACDADALRINHYSRDAWRDAVPPMAAASRFAAWIRPHCAVEKVSSKGKPYTVARGAGYNVLTFDWPRLRALFGQQFCPIDYLQRDVLQRVIFHCDEIGEAPENFKLATVAAWLRINTDGAHDALFDVRLCATVYRAIVQNRW